MEKILLVGGAGYVGSVLAQELLDRGYSVRILDRLYYGDRGLEPIRDRVDLIVADMRNVDASVFKDVRAVINVGGLSNDPCANHMPRINYEMNTVATVSLARAAIASGVHRYVFASTCSIYDTGVSSDARDVIQTEDSDVDPRAAYSSSKHQAERGLLDILNDDPTFCPVILRKGTIYGFSPRMRYDLVVNTFVRHALDSGVITLHYGGEMWRPLIDIRDVARAYVACIEAPDFLVRGEVFNLSHSNFRISELALRVKDTLSELNIDVEIDVDYGYKGVRSYRVSTDKIQRVLGFVPKVSVEESVINMVAEIDECGYSDFGNPRYYNIGWTRLLEEAHEIAMVTGKLFDIK